MVETKTNTRLLEAPLTEMLLPEDDVTTDVLTSLSAQEKSYDDELGRLSFSELLIRAKELQKSDDLKNAIEFLKMSHIVAGEDDKKPAIDFDDLMIEAKDFEGASKYDEAFDAYQLARYVTDKSEFNKVGTIEYKMADMLHKQADSAINDKKTSLDMLDKADNLLRASDENFSKARALIDENKLAGQKAFEEAVKFHDMAENSDDDVEDVRMPLLNISEDALNKSDRFYAQANKHENDEYAPTPVVTKKRHLGARAIMRFKSAIKSTLNRHN